MVPRIKHLVLEVYKVHNQAKLPEVDSFFEKYRDCEYDFYTAVCNKYGVQPVEFGALGARLWQGGTVTLRSRSASQARAVEEGAFSAAANGPRWGSVVRDVTSASDAARRAGLVKGSGSYTEPGATPVDWTDGARCRRRFSAAGGTKAANAVPVQPAPVQPAPDAVAEGAAEAVQKAARDEIARWNWGLRPGSGPAEKAAADETAVAAPEADPGGAGCCSRVGRCLDGQARRAGSR